LPSYSDGEELPKKSDREAVVESKKASGANTSFSLLNLFGLTAYSAEICRVLEAL
jgi:hypothetical protein